MKKLVAIVTALCLLLTLGVGSALAKPPAFAAKAQGVAAGQDFNDTGDHWAKLSIKKMHAHGLVKGYEDGSFRPDSPLSEDEAAVLIFRIVVKKLNLPSAGDEDEDEDEDENEDENEDEEEAAAGAEDEDADVEEDDESVVDEAYASIPGWARRSVYQVVYQNQGFDYKRFHSRLQCTRLMACLMLGTYLYQHYDELKDDLNLPALEDVDLPENLPFRDAGLIEDEKDLKIIYALYQAGIIKGDPEGNFNPRSALKRAEMVTIMERILGEE